MNTKRTITTLAAFATFQAAAFAQQAISSENQVISPEIHPDRTVTFRLRASMAKEVKLMGDWMPSSGWFPVAVPMERDSAGTWTYTSGVLNPELYIYSFLVDGLRVIDPSNAFVSRDIATLSSIFIIEGDQSDLYRVKDVPHGSVTRTWYHSPILDMDRRISIYTPPGYGTGGLDYPVLYLLHGAGGDEEAWLSLGRSSQIMDNLIADGMVEPMIMVMPNGNVSQDAAPGEGTQGYITPRFMVPGTMDGTFEKTFPEIMEFVENSYRVNEGRDQRAIAGLSMGGF
ncbi:MAG: esterase, partial [Bacteroidetes bacterium]